MEVLDGLFSKIDSTSLVLIPDKNCFSFSDTSPVCCLLDGSGRGLSTLASLTVRVAFFSEHAMNVIAVRYYMDLTDTLMDVLWSSRTHTKCGYEVVNPLGACLDPRWLSHCLYQCHSINDIYALSWQGTIVSSNSRLLINVINPMFSKSRQGKMSTQTL